MQLIITESDDIEVIRDLMLTARQFRRKAEPKSAITAAKVEMLFLDSLADFEKSLLDAKRKEAA